MSMDSGLFDITLLELTAGHIVLDRLGAPREIEEDGIVRECEIAERIKFLHAGPQIKSAPSTITPALDAAIQDEIEHGPKDISR